MPTFGERVVKAWNAFRNRDPTEQVTGTTYYHSYSTSYRPDQRRYYDGSERSIIASIKNRIAVDAAAIDIRHIKVDDEERYVENVNDELNDILTLEANIDQSAREFKQDVYASMLDEGYVAICPITADVNYSTMSINKIQSARVGRILTWHPKSIEVEMYNEETGKREQTTLPKSICVIVQNPFYQIMNAPNSLMQRLKRKLALLDQIDEKTASGKLDMIIQLPYSTRQETQKERAEGRRKDLEDQLNGSRYGIGYIDVSEKVIQLGRPLDNTLQAQIDTLNKQLHDELGMCPEILNGTANELTKLNYTNNILEPVVSAFTDGMTRKWLTETARTQGHRIRSFMNGFRVVPVTEIAKTADALIRNQILTANEFRGILGFKPSDQQSADMLMNPNMPLQDQIDPYATNETNPGAETYVENNTGYETPDESQDTFYDQNAYQGNEEPQSKSAFNGNWRERIDTTENSETSYGNWRKRIRSP